VVDGMMVMEVLADTGICKRRNKERLNDKETVNTGDSGMGSRP